MNYQQLIRSDNTYIHKSCKFFGNLSKVYIGKYCSVANNVVFDCGEQHNSNYVSTFDFGNIESSVRGKYGHPKTYGDTHIGNDVWIGHGCYIRSGVTIGDGAIIGTKSVVTKNIEPYSICAGYPAEIKKYRFEADIIKKLLEIQWWNWPDAIVKDCIPELMSNCIERFVDIYHDKK
jgi:acetyltransferase-like isoleucine patch superfamily enzyme